MILPLLTTLFYSVVVYKKAASNADAALNTGLNVILSFGFSIVAYFLSGWMRWLAIGLAVYNGCKSLQ